MSVTSTNDIEQNTRVLAKKVDVIYAPTDNTVASAMATVGKISQETKIPVIPAEENMMKAGGIATISINYEELGKQTAKMAIEVLKGNKKIENMPVEFQNNPKTIINKAMAEKLGITIPADLQQYAE